jgi:hypothetical protein
MDGWMDEWRERGMDDGMNTCQLYQPEEKNKLWILFDQLISSLLNE